jgi:hypothetical protein
MVYKLASSKTIIRKVMRDLKPPGDNWIDDAVEWMGEALEHIGSAPQLSQKGCVLTVSNFKALMPTDLYYINQVAVNNAVNPSVAVELTELLEKVDTLNAQILADPNDSISFNYQLRDLNARIVVLENLYMNSGQPLTPLQYGTGTFPAGMDCEDCQNMYGITKPSYTVDGDYIKTSFQDGAVCLSYTAFPVDDDCFPMVPDDISFKEAMFWYIYKQMLLGGYTPSMNGIDYDFADAKWKFYCSQARNQSNYPSIDKYESFMNQWVRLVPNLNRHANFFENLGTRETLDRGRYTNYGIL